MILIGSRAAMFRNPNIISRKPKDFDFICSQDECDEWIKKNHDKLGKYKQYTILDGKKTIVEGESAICEFEIVQPNHSSELLVELVNSDKETIETNAFGKIPSLNILFAIKQSHRYLKNSPHFWKTLFDWHKIRDSGAKIKEEHKAFLKLREKETYAKQKHPSLTGQTKDSFFSVDHGIKYVYDHDSIHEAVKHLDKPAYKYYAKDNDPIKSDKNKFFAAKPEVRFYGVAEECSVLGNERGMIPYPDKWESPDKAWLFAFSKVCSSITSGWFRQWAYENAMEILANRPKDFYEKFKIGLANGTVKKI